ncbi:MAG: type III-A CRISPR-associated protein Csm2 [Candidatus Hodarchaeota archaeon]
MRQRKMNSKQQIDPIITKINGLDRLGNYLVKDFAEQGKDADIIAKVCQNSLKPSQMRRFFDQARRIQRDITYGREWLVISPQISMLQPLLYYAKSRRVIPDEFLNIMRASLAKIDKGRNDAEKIENFQRFMEFFQAIVAYHKYYNPRG